MGRLIGVALSALAVLAACGGSTTKAPGGGLVGGALPPPSPAPGLRLPRGVTPLRYDVTLEVDPASEAFRGEVRIDVVLTAATDRFWIHQVGLTVDEATFEVGTAGTGGVAARPGGRLRALGTGDQMTAYWFGHEVPAGPVTLRFAFGGHMLTDEEGLFRQTDRGEPYVFSQAEALMARRIVPCFDEPGWKTPWTVHAVVPAGQLAVSNAPELRHAPRADGKVVFDFAPTRPMASYLLALAVGPFDVVDLGPVGRAHVPVRIVTSHGLGVEAATSAALVPGIVIALENYFDLGLPWPKLDLVTVPRFFGAMENPGLITFDAQSMLGRPDDAGIREHFVPLAAHELAHQWFGDLVTPVWWDDLWLNEAFASWLEAKIATQIDPAFDGALDATTSRADALDVDTWIHEDALRRQVASAEDIESSFDEIAYDKGKAVLAMIESWIGAPAMQRGVRAYIHDHADGSATARDFIAALTGAASPKVAAAFRSFLEQPGAPRLDVELSCRKNVPTLTVAQAPMLGATHSAPWAANATAAASGGGAPVPTWSVPMCLRYPTNAGGKVVMRACVVVGAEPIELILPSTKGCPAWIVANADGAGYYRVRWRGPNPLGPLPPLAILKPAERLAIADDLAALVRAGDGDAASLAKVAQAWFREPDPYARLGALDLVAVLEDFVTDARLPAFRTWQDGAFGRDLKLSLGAPSRTHVERLWRAKLLDLLPLPAARREARGLLDAQLAGHGTIDAQDLALVVRAATHDGDAALFTELRSAAAVTSDERTRRAYLRGLGNFPAAQASAAVQLLGDPELGWQRTLPIVESFLARRDTMAPAWELLRADLGAVLQRATAVQATALIAATEHFCDAAHRAQIDATLRPRLAAFYDGARALDHALLAIDRCIDGRARHDAAIGEWLASHPKR